MLDRKICISFLRSLLHGVTANQERGIMCSSRWKYLKFSSPLVDW